MVSASRLNSLVLQGAAELKPVQKFVERRRYAIGVNRKPKSNHPTHQQEPTNSAVHFYRGLSPISYIVVCPQLVTQPCNQYPNYYQLSLEV
jgi:hypothetical protein